MIRKGQNFERNIKKYLCNQLLLKKIPGFCIRCAKEKNFDLIFKKNNEVFLIEVKSTKENIFYFSKNRRVLLQIETLRTFAKEARCVPILAIMKKNKIYFYNLEKEHILKKINLEETKQDEII